MKVRKNNSNQKKPQTRKSKSVSIVQLFQFSTASEKFLIFAAVIFSIATGVIQPCSILIYGRYISNLTQSLSNTDQLLRATAPVIHIMAYMGTAVLVSAYLSNCLWVLTGESQTRRIRSLYLHSVLRQDMGWFDSFSDGSLNTRLSADTQLIQDGISEKFGLLVTLSSQFAAGMVVAFIRGWELAIISLAVLPLMSITVVLMAKYMRKYIRLSQDAYAGAGAVAEQTFNSIRTIYSFSLQNRMLALYEKELDKARKTGIKRGIAVGAGFAFYMLFFFLSYALVLWYGSKLVRESKMSGSDVLVVFLSMMMGCIAFIRLPTNLSAVTGACGCACKVYEIIKRTPEINPDSKEGTLPSSVNGSLELNQVVFKYPTRPNLTILKGISLKIEPGTTVAFVGSSGSGKSTIIQLIQRFYDPISGNVSLDGRDIKNLSVRWLRQQIGVVSQEPILFNMSIRENLLLGSQENVSNKELIEACEEANCHNFITQLPQGYNTMVGDHGGMLSGGQKQRIAIARAILKKPSILLLDEATSALDTQSERLVQRALDKASSKRTTIVVAHRLSTVRNADLIVVMDQGSILEKGSHADLVKKNGVYSGLVSKQAVGTTCSKEEASRLEEEEAELQKTIVSNETELLKKDVVDIHTNTSEHAKTNTAENNKSENSIENPKSLTWRVLLDMRPEWWIVICGAVSSVIAGCVFPVYALIFSKAIVLINTPGVSLEWGPLEGANLFAFIFVFLGVFGFIGFGGQNTALEIAGEKYTRRLRAKVFDSYLRQEIGFFDSEENNTGSLISKLSVDARNVNEVITRVWGDIIAMFSTVAFGLIVAMTYSWALTLIIVCFSPIIICTTAYERSVQKGFEDKTKKANANSGKVAGEAIREVRTVASLNQQAYFEERYLQSSEEPHRLATRKAYLSSIAYSLNKSINIYTMCLSFYAGVRLIMNGMIDFSQMFTSMTIIMTASESAGRSSTFLSTWQKANNSAIASFSIIERTPIIDSQLEGAEPTCVDGDIEFKNVAFRYPSRSEQPIFDGHFCLQGKKNQTIALVGPSGCGKSTTIGMLQRWYDPLDGNVMLDNTNVQSYSLSNLRSHMALVSQEPSLFDMTIEENIRFGIAENLNVDWTEIESACRAANIHDFIKTLPGGYATRVGDKGSQLSGGQKQRIAIARALIRKPKILLLDEATSALDSDSEKAVQEAIDNVLSQGGRTTITIAHRLSTIQNADVICVIKDGMVVEKGTHWGLLSKNGVYKELVKEQSLNVL
ncbi:P-loop containing nucleoside triphosphate hydrolase protein [Sporodiniella umbellata]|nr:P-loop containing nucleoside triphosphate hydrolase protein [Sporodiniella umbellata]